MTEAALNERQRRFVEYYMGEARGNATSAARLAGYKQPQMQGSRLMKKDEVQTAISSLVEICPAAASRHDLQDFWTTVMYDPRVNINSRLKASELLAKSQGFLHAHSNEHTLMTLSDADLVRLAKSALKTLESDALSAVHQTEEAL